MFSVLFPFSNSAPWFRSCCRLFGWAGLLAGLVWLVVSGIFFSSASDKVSTWSSVQATVVALEPVRSERNLDELYVARFRFTAADGQAYEVVDTLRANPPAYALGETVELHHPAHEPARAVRNTFISLYLLPCIFFCNALLFSGVGGILLWGGRRKV